MLAKPRPWAELGHRLPRPVGFWLLSDGVGDRAYDKTGNNHGTRTGTAIDWAAIADGPGIVGTGAGTTDRIDLGSIDSANPLSLSATDACTIIFRAYHESTAASGAFPRIIDKSTAGSGAGGWGLWYYTTTDAYTFRVDSEATYPTTGAVSRDTWHTGIIRRDGTDWRFFILEDGGNLAETNGTASSSTIPTTTANCAIGNWNSAGGRMLDGNIAFVGVWDTAFADALCRQVIRDPYRHIFCPRRKVLDFTAAAGGVSVTPSAGSVSVTGYAPTVSVAGAVSVTPGAGSVAVTGNAPSVSAAQSVNVTPGAGAVAITGYAPAVAIGQIVNVTPGFGAITITGYAPAISAARSVDVTPGSASVVVLGHAPTLVILDPDAVAPRSRTSYAKTESRTSYAPPRRRASWS